MKDNILHWVISLFFPQQCIECKTIQKNIICNECLQKVTQNASVKNITQKISIDYYFSYEASIKEILHQIKFKKSIELAQEFAKKIAVLPLPQEIQDKIEDYWIVIPIPSHPKRIKSRGFNHVSILFGDWIVEKNLVILPLLKRKKHTQALFNLNPKEREDEVKDAFELLYPENVKNKNILLIDDIATSGTTLAEAHQLLTHHGAKHIKALTIAYTPKPGS
jgi:ComF family protein